MRSTLKNDTLKAVTQSFCSIGFKRGQGGGLFRTVNDETVAFIGIPLRVDRQTGVLDVWLNVGVRNERIHALMHDLLGRPECPTCCLNLLTNVGYLLPEQRLKEWTVCSHGDITSAVEHMVATYLHVGEPFVTNYSSFRAVIEAPVYHRNSLTWMFAEPCALILLGDFAGARASVRSTLDELARTPGSAFEEEFRSFIQKMEESIAQRQTQSG